jgi:putative tricarboxylic transport membrane protein
MKRYEQVYNLFWTFLALGICFQAVRLKLWGPSGPETGFVPFMAGLIIGTGGLSSFILQRLKGVDTKMKEGRFWENPGAGKRIISVLVAFGVMASFMPILGFLLTSIIVLIFLFQLTEPRKWVKVTVVAILCCLSFYFFFNLFQVNLPKGFLGF